MQHTDKQSESNSQKKLKMSNPKNTTILGMDAPHNIMNSSVVCYQPNYITSNGVWHDQNPLDYSLPLFTLQLMIIVLTLQVTVFVLKFLGQPKVIAEIIGGVLLGPSALGHFSTFGKAIFPLKSMVVLEVMAKIGLLYFMFLMGVEMDLNVAKHASRHAIITAVAGVIIPFFVAISIALLYNGDFASVIGMFYWGFTAFMSVIMSITAFPVLARVIADLKLFNTELATVSTSVAVINDIFAWTVLVMAIVWNKILSGSYTNKLVFTSAIFLLFCFVVLRPAIMWSIRSTSERENFSELFIGLILTGVLICGFITDFIGLNYVFGGFVFGVIIPNGPLGKALMENVEGFVNGLLLPLFFAINGLKTDVFSIVDLRAAGFLSMMIILASIAKVVITFLVSILHEMKPREALSLGLLMNTKGLMEIIVISIAKDMGILDNQAYAIIVLITVVMTAITAPAIGVIFRVGKHFIPYKRRTIQKLKMNKELKIAMCIHSSRNVPTMINLLEASHATNKSPIHIYALHLVELIGNATTMLIEHNAYKTSNGINNSEQTQSQHIIHAFENYAQRTKYVTVQPLTAISPYSTMHEDICNLAENNQTTLIIVPFHKQQTIDGGMELTNPAFRTINRNVLANAPCSVCILIDRGFGSSVSQISHHIAVIFIGGPDDREALAYGCRMAEHPSVSLTVIRLVDGNDEEGQNAQHPHEDNAYSIIVDNEREKKLDDDFICEFRLRTVTEESITYKETIVKNVVDTMAAIRSMESIHDFYIVGRGQGMDSSLTAGLIDFSECPELGAIGDFLASSDFARTVSVLVVQQYIGERIHDDSSISTGSPVGSIVQYDVLSNNHMMKHGFEDHERRCTVLT